MTAHDLAVEAHHNAILRCWTRETGTTVTGGAFAVPAGEHRLTATVVHASATGRHEFADVRLDDQPVEPERLVRVLSDQAGADRGEIDDLATRTAESVRNVAMFVTDPGGASRGADRFLDGEQALLLGHLNHPAPKSRDGIGPAELATYSPEIGGRFQVHWFEADAGVVSYDQVTGSPPIGRMTTPELMAALAGRTPADGTVLVPAHPWQAADALLNRPRVIRLVEQGRLRPLGPLGAQWFATSSLRTLYHPDLPVMLKLSLGLRITNSRRESTPTELRRGLEIHRLIDTGYTPAYEDFFIVRDPAWLAVDELGPELTGLDVAVRETPDSIADHVCLAGLVAPRPAQGLPSRLGEYVGGLGHDAAPGWVASYVDAVLVPMLRLYASTGIGLEAHQQNTLVRLDAEGNVTGGAYRDNQGYYLAASRLPELLRHTGAEQSTLAVVDDAVVDDRLTYYLLHNQALAVVGSLAAEGLAAEDKLLAVVRDRLSEALPTLRADGPDGDRLARRWLTAPSLPCKANMLTRLRGIDEVVAPLDAQSVYLDVPNPLAAVTR